MGEWSVCSVSDLQGRGILLVEDGNHGENRPRPDEFSSLGVSFIRAADMQDGRVLFESASRINDIALARIRKGKGKVGDVLLSHKGTVGKVAFVREVTPFVCSPQTTFWRSLDQRILDRRYLYYFLCSSGFHTQLAQRKGETDMADYVSLSNQRDLLVTLPPYSDQIVISRVLGALDDKIDLNRRMSETLEATARALFKSWFVDFDPVRAKDKGLDLGLPKPLADLFPARLVGSKLGETPEGWEVGCVNDEFELTMGQSPPGETYNKLGEGLPFFQGSTDFGFRFPTRRVYCTAPTRLAKRGDTLISVRAPVGDINIASENCAIRRGIAAARHRTGSRSYSYQFMRSLKEVFAGFEAEGTVFGSIGKRDFHAIACVKPPRDLVINFERRLEPVDSRIEVNERESRTLAALRDTLLPKLISGELRIKDAERFVEAAV